MLLLDVVMVFRRNVPRWARVFDDAPEGFVTYLMVTAEVGLSDAV